MSIYIHQAGLDELETLMQWRMEVLAAVFEMPLEQIIEKHEQANRAYYRKHLSDGSHIAVFARQDQQIVGCAGLCLYEEMPSPDNPTGKCAYFMNVYVRPQWRKKGIAAQMVQSLIDQARALNISKIYLETSEMGRGVYASLGFKEMKDYLKL